MTPLLLVAAALAFAAALFLHPVYLHRRRERWAALPFPEAWRRILWRRVPIVARLSAAQRRELESRIQVFVREKRFVGCDGQEIDDDVRVTIAAQAALLVLGH